jgi:hypothetical protein
MVLESVLDCRNYVVSLRASVVCVLDTYGSQKWLPQLIYLFFVLHLSYPLDGQCYRTMSWEGIVSCAAYVIAVFFH